MFNPPLFLIPCIFWGIIELQCCNYSHLHYQVIFHPNFNIPWQYFITHCWQENVGFWPMDELIHHPWQCFSHLFIQNTSSEKVSTYQLTYPLITARIVNLIWVSYYTMPTLPLCIWEKCIIFIKNLKRKENSFPFASVANHATTKVGGVWVSTGKNKNSSYLKYEY